MQYLEFRIEYVVFNDNNLPCYYDEKICLKRDSEWNIEKVIFVTLTEKCNELGYDKAELVSFSLIGTLEVSRKNEAV